MLFRWYSLVPVVLALGGCDFFTLDEPDENEPQNPGTGGTGGSGGTGGAKGGTGGAMGGAGGATAGTAGTTTMAGTGGSAGNSGNGGSAGAVAGGAGAGNSGGASAGAAGSAGAGGANGGAAGQGSGGLAGGGAGGSGPCASINPQAQAFGGHCYYLNSAAVAWPAAKDACVALSAGGHLVTITSQAEQTFVWGLANMADVWIGATDGKMENEPGEMSVTSMWITGEDIMQFNGWASGEPNNYQKTCSSGSGDCWEHCGFMWVDTQGAWNDDICGYEKAYICEWDTGG
jgi:hypothetical protein